ncbi:MAG TPA: hypothetical protein VN681_15180 [Stellaceae bacterium]|nr:hypothetical protein [Stellaceae bacterium]
MGRTIGIALAAAALVFAATGANAAGMKEYKTEAAARKHCPRDEIVYGTHKERTFHRKDEERYGKIKGGRYVCLSEAEKGGWHEHQR